MATTLYQVSPTNGDLMNCYIIKTENGKLIVIDGGGRYSDESTKGYLCNELKKISGKDEIIIEAWFLTHIHDDHITEYILASQNESVKITVKNTYFNFASHDFYKNAEDGRFEHLYPSISQAYNRFSGDGAFEKAHGKTVFEGDSFEIDNLKFDILCVCNDEENETRINDTSIVFRVTVDGQTILFLGDSNINQGNKLLKKYGKSIHSDIVQMAHHGQNGVSEEVYATISPTLCMWPSPDWVFDNTFGHLQTFETRKWITNLGVKYHLITGRHRTQSISLPVDFSKLTEEDITPNK